MGLNRAVILYVKSIPLKGIDGRMEWAEKMDKMAA